MFDCPTLELSPTINQCGDTLSDSTAVFSWNDPQQTNSTAYDFWIGSAPLTNDVYDLIGGGLFNGNSLTATGLPVDGRTLYKTLYISRAGDFSDTQTVECICTAATLDQFKITADFGDTDIPFGGVSNALFESFFTDTNGGSYNFGIETLDNLAIVDGCMYVRHAPNPAIGQTASGRTIFVGNIPPSQCYCAEQKVTFNPTAGAFDFGGPAPFQTIKIGYGLGGGSDVVGGGGNDPCGWTLRWITRGNEIRGYSYAFGRPAGTFGQDIPTGVFVNPGDQYDLKMKVCMNTDGNSDGSYELYINGVLVASDYNQIWMDHTQCNSANANVIDSLIYNSVYGGTNSATQSWFPDTTQYITFCDPCYTAINS